MNILPESRARHRSKGAKGAVERNGVWWEPVYCANCGRKIGIVPEENITSTFFLCDKRCADSWATVAGTMVEPDVLFFQRVADEQFERYGRLLGPLELLKALDDVNHPLSRLVRERLELTPKAG